MPIPVLRVDNVAADAGGLRLTFEAAAGECVGLWWRNCATRALFAAAAGVSPVRSGVVAVQGIDTAARRIEARALVSACFADTVDPTVRAGEFLAAVARSRPVRFSPTAIAARVGLDLRLPADRLSSRTHIALAASLMARCRLLVLGEPFVDLPPHARTGAISAVAAVAQDGAAVLFASRHEDDVRATCRRVVEVAIQ